MSAQSDSSTPRSISGAPDAPVPAAASAASKKAARSVACEAAELRAARDEVVADIARARASLERLERLVAALDVSEDVVAADSAAPSAAGSAAARGISSGDASSQAEPARGEAPHAPSPVKPAQTNRDLPNRDLPLYTLGEEIANAVTHGIGVLLASAGLVLLIVKAALGGGEPTHMASAIVFGATLILEYLASTLYHAIAAPRAKRVFRTIDHSSIYLLIAGSYTPFCLITLAHDGGIVLFVVVWALAFAGISFEIIGRQRQPRWVTILIYLVMGWLVVFRLPQLIAALDPVALALLTVGGLCYTIGCAFYVLKKIRYMHSVWHLWVLAGSIFIFMAVILYVI